LFISQLIPCPEPRRTGSINFSTLIKKSAYFS